MRYPNRRYGNPTEFRFYAMGVPLAVLARRLRRDERTVRDWLSGRARVPWWVPEVMRLQRVEHELRHRQMGMGALPARLGVVSADVVALPRPALDAEKLPQPGVHPPVALFPLLPGAASGMNKRAGR